MMSIGIMQANDYTTLFDNLKISLVFGLSVNEYNEITLD